MKRKIVFLILSIAFVSIIIVSSTYSALFKVDNTEEQKYATGTLAITSNATNNSVTLTNSLPMSDEDGATSSPYTFKITNVGNLSFKFDVKFLSTTTSNMISSQYIKIKVNDEPVTTLSALTNGIILSSKTLKPQKSLNVTLRVWLSIDTPNTEIGKVFNAKITTEGQAVYTDEPIDLALKTLKSLGLDDSISNTTPNFLTGTTTDEGIHAMVDDQGTSYYFRGDVTNNYVKFGKYTEDAYAIYDSSAGTSSYANSCGDATDCTKIASAGDDMYWRIIRINGDGTIRMIYDGTSPYENNESTANKQIGKSMFNRTYNDNAYVGYMYGQINASNYADTHANVNDSSIKTTIDRWYSKYLNNSYSSYIANAIYCNDRKLVTDDNKYNIFFAGETTIAGSGIGRDEYGMYGFNNRYTETDDGSIVTSYNPSLICEQVNDRFTLQGVNFITLDGLGGNNKLTYPVGLITADEVVLAGAIFDIGNSFYLSANDEYLTGTASGYSIYKLLNTGGTGPLTFSVDESRLTNAFNSLGPYGVRPVISLNADALMYDAETSDGSKEHPFVVDNPAQKTLTKLGLDGSVKTDTPDFSKASYSTCDTEKDTTCERTIGIYETQDDLGISYYFRGDVENNYVKFGKNSSNQDMYWRIIRVNGDGTIRMIYDGTTAHANGVASEDKIVNFSDFNPYNYNAYVGYMYGTPGGASYELEHANINNSIVKTFLEGEPTSTNTGWYYENIINTGYNEYVADAIYCNDRSLYSGPGYDSDDEEETVYGAYGRIRSDITPVSPILTCPNSNDRFTKEGSLLNPLDGRGTNEKNKYSIGLISADEAVMAGATYDGSNKKYYLYSGDDFWTMTPSMFSKYAMGAGMYVITSYGTYEYTLAIEEIYSGAIRPVITLKADVLKYDASTSNGSIEYPFVLSN